MRVMPVHTYREYDVVINTAKEMGGGFADAFSIHEHKDGMHANTRMTAHQRSVTIAERFPSEAEAIERATQRAHKWIDLQYV